MYKRLYNKFNNEIKIDLCKFDCIFSFAVLEESIEQFPTSNRYMILKNHKEIECSFFKEGFCKKGNICDYIHENNEQILNDCLHKNIDSKYKFNEFNSYICNNLLYISKICCNCNMIKNDKGFCEDELCKCDCHVGSSFRRGNRRRQYC